MPARLAPVLALLAAACRQGAATPTPADAPVLRADAGTADAAAATCDPLVPDGGFEVAVVARVLAFETQAAPTGPVRVALHSAWASPPIFPLACTPFAEATVGPAEGFVASLGPASSPISFVVAMVVDGAGVATSINDKRLPMFPCKPECAVGSAASPYPVWLISSDTFAAWKAAVDAAAGPVDWSTHGLAAVTFRQGDGSPAAGVAPSLNPARPLYYLAADRRALETRTATGSSGTVIILLDDDQDTVVSGALTGVVFEHNVHVATAPDSVFFEQIDPM